MYKISTASSRADSLFGETEESRLDTALHQTIKQELQIVFESLEETRKRALNGKMPT